MNVNPSFEKEHLPKRLKDEITVFPPNISLNGSCSWWVDIEPEPVLIDCPSVNKEMVEHLRILAKGRKPKILLTNRDSHGRVADLHSELGWDVVIQ